MGRAAWIGAVLLPIALLLIGAGFLGYSLGVRTIITEPTEIVLPQDSTSRDAAAILAREKALDRPWLFLAAVRISGAEHALRAGRYILDPGMTILDILGTLVDGRPSPYRLTLPEGIDIDQALDRIRAAPDLSGVILEPPAEGSLLPETYFYPFGYSRRQLIERMSQAMDAVLEEAWEGRAPGLPLDRIEEALILASIVEKETARPDERPKVAAVFLNRLRRGMRLQSDPTVLYAIKRRGMPLPRRLRRADLAAPGPWNTYRHAGLPPTPICLPSAASIRAVLHPAPGEDLYFVADGEGGHHFSRSLAEHNRHVRRLRRR